MSCKEEAEKEGDALRTASRTTLAQVSGAPTCPRPGCGQPLNEAGKCPRGHGLEGEPEGAAEAVRCPHCQAILEDGACGNDLCSSRLAAPGVPGPENGYRWVRPKGPCPSDALRKKYNIPPDAVVEVGASWGGGRITLTFHDPRRRGLWGEEQEEFLQGAEPNQATALARNPGASGFVSISEEEWEKTHPTRTNPLIDVPGVDVATVEARERELEPAPKQPETAPPTRFTPSAKWRSWDEKHWKRTAEREAEFLAAYPDLDAPLDFTVHTDYGEHQNHLGIKTPRQVAGSYYALWGIGSHAHHEEAERLAAACGVQLIAGDLCPMVPPGRGQGNPLYLFDYQVDGEPVGAFGFELNRHLLYGFPYDERDHKHGWDALPRVVGWEEGKRNWQNWAIVHLGWNPESGGTQRHSGVEIEYGVAKDEAEARAGAQVIAAMLLRTGHDPQAECRYEVVAGEERRQVTTTVGGAAAGHQARPAPRVLAVTPAGRELLTSVLRPYQTWQFQRPTAGTPEAKRAANQLKRAALSLREGLRQAHCEDEGLLHALAQFSADAKDRAEGDPGGMIADFCLLKQRAHNLMRGSDWAREVFGGGFVQQFVA